LSLKLDNVETSLAITENKLERKSETLKIVEADLKAKWLLLESAQQALAKREGSANMMISSAVAHTATLFKNHLPDLNMEILRQDFTVDDAERETLVSARLMLLKTLYLHTILLVLLSPMTMIAQRVCNSSSAGCKT
jgi:hypothetical protein